MYNGSHADHGWASIPKRAVNGWKDVYVGNLAWWCQGGRSLNELIEKEALF